MLTSRMTQSTHFGKRERGVTLIEILYAMFMVVVFVAGSIAYNLDAINDSTGSLNQTQAAAIASDMANRIRLNRDYALGANNRYLFNSATYTMPKIKPSCHKKDTTGCTRAQIANQDLYHWAINFSDPGGINNFVPTIPAGSSKITRSGNKFNIEVSWDEIGFSIISGNVQKANKTAKYTLSFSL